jgi:hypothetical protein
VADGWSHLTHLRTNRAHLGLNLFAVQPNDLAHIFGMHQRLGIIERGLIVLLASENAIALASGGG